MAPMPYELRALGKFQSTTTTTANRGDQSNIVKIVYTPALNHFLFVDDQGRLFLGDGNGEIIFGPIKPMGGENGSKISIDFSNGHNCLLAWDGKRLNSRRDFGGTWFLKTILADKPEPESMANVELTLNEAGKLLQYFRSPVVKLNCTDDDLFTLILADLQMKLESAKDEEKCARGHKWSSVLLSGSLDFLHTTLTTALTDLKQSGLRVPILPVLSSVVERFNLLKENPFAYELHGDTPGHDKAIMVSEAIRRQTFSRWPHTDYKWALPDQMAEAGFYHHPNTSGDDRVFCFTCTVCLVCWEPSDEPWSEHERHAATCPFVKGEYTANVPMSVTYASSSALKTDCDDEVSCVSSSIFCDWVASSTLTGEVVLWNIAKDLKKCDPILLDPTDPLIEANTAPRRRRCPKSVVALADIPELTSPATSATSSNVAVEAPSEPTEGGAKETAGETGSSSFHQKGDFLVTALCTFGQPNAKQTISEMLDEGSKCSPALAVGCAISEMKLHHQQNQRPSETSPSSFVENLNTVNKATSEFNECILPPSKTPVSGAACSTPDEKAPLFPSSIHHPFLLVYKIEETEPETNPGAMIGENSRRTGAGAGAAPPSSVADKNVLTSVKEMDESLSLGDDDDEDYEHEHEQPDNIVTEHHHYQHETILVDHHKHGLLKLPYNDNDLDKTIWPPYYDDPSPAPSKPSGSKSKLPSFENAWVTSSPSVSGAAGTGTTATPTTSATSTDMATAIGSDSPDAKKELMANQEQQTDDSILKNEYQPPKATLSILQCIRLPSQFDQSAYYVHSITPAPDGTSLLVVVNRHEHMVEEDSALQNTPSSALLCYRVSYSCHLSSVVEQPYRQIPFADDVGNILSASYVQSMSDDGIGPNLVAILTAIGEVQVIDIAMGTAVAKSSPPIGLKYTAVCSLQDDKLCVACEDGSVSMMELKGPDALADETDMGNQFYIDDVLEYKDPELLVNKPLTLDVLKDLWNLTRSDWVTSGQFSMQAPSSWIEVQQHQRQRKNPQHYLREEKLAKSWHLIPDGETWFEHIFELTLPVNFGASHIDFRFALHRAGLNEIPPIQVTFLRQLPTSASRSISVARESLNVGFLDAGPSSSSSSSADPLGASASAQEFDDFSLKTRVFSKQFQDNLNAEIVAGPFSMQSAMDLYNLNGLVQFSSAQLNNSKLRTFFIHVQALTKGNVEVTKPKAITTDPKKGLQRVASAGSASSMEKMSSAGLYQQKYGMNKYGVPTGKSSAASTTSTTRAVNLSKNMADSRKMEDLRGCDWIKEVSVTVWKTKKTSVKKEKKQRAAMIRNSDFISNLVNALADPNSCADVNLISCQQYLSLDLLIWITHQGTSENKRVLQTLINAMENRLDQLFRSCYIHANRTISRKFTALIADALLKIKIYDPDGYSGFLACLKDVARRFLFSIDSYRNSGSVLWLVALAEELYKLSATGSSVFVSEMQDFLCQIGEVLKQRSNAHCKTALGKYGLMGFPFELELFELQPPVLMLYHRAQQPFSYAVTTTAQATITANFISDFAYEENDWLEIAGVEYVPPNGTSPKSNRRGRTIRLEREHLYGLIEVEPLQFTCYAASDGIKIENLDTGVSMSVAGANAAVPTSTGAGPIPLPDISQYEQSGNPALTNAVTSMKQQVQSILSKQMQLLAIQQQKQKLQVKLTDHVEKLANLAAEQIPATQASSASTFGVPTTPKTTPFMTPTPLSPSHLSPINSEMDLHFDDASVDVEERPFETSGERRPKLVPSEFLKPPPVQALVVERMSSGARKYVIITFDGPILLTDLVVPQCGDIGSLSIDVWLKSESDDGQRLVVCNDISQKTLVLCDLQPPCLCQYLKITYIGRQGLGSCTSKIAVGNFYGYTYATPSQLCILDSGGVENTGAIAKAIDESKNIRRPSLSIEQLRQLEEDIACRYSLACDLLRNLLDPPETPSTFVEGPNRDKEVESTKIKELCREISSIRIQWNLVHRAIERMNVAFGTQPVKSFGGDWTGEGVSYDKARVISELLFASMVRISPLMNLDIEIDTALLPNPDSRSVLSLTMALDFFEQFSISGIPCLTALSTSWILEHGAWTSWWGALFGSILDRFFAEEADTQRSQKIFLILSFLVDRGLACGNNSIFLDMLQRLNNQLPEGPAVTFVQQSFQLTLILLSHGFDNFPHGRMVGSRWDFLLGEYSRRRHSSPKLDGDSNSNPNRNAKIVGNYGYFKDALYQSEELIAQHHQKVMQLSSELKEYVKNKPFKPTTFLKHKSSTQLPYAANSGYITFPAQSKPSNEARTRHPASADSAGASTSGLSASSSQKKPRLKLPYDLCRSVAQKLALLILRNDLSLSAEVFILMCKVLSIISRCSRPLLHLSDVFVEREQINQLIRTVVTSRNIYARRALICLVQDFLASEAKCDNARQSAAATKAGMGGSASSQGLLTTLGSESSGNLVDVDVETRPSHPPPTMAASSSQQEFAECIKKLLKTQFTGDEQSTSAAAASSASVPDTSSTPSTSTATATKPKADFGLQFGSPKLVDTPSGAQAYIEGWVETIKPLPVANSKISEEKRLQRLRDMYREILFGNAAKYGLQLLQDTKGCTDYVMAMAHSEQNMAKCLQTEAQYDSEMDKLQATFADSSDVEIILESKSFQEALEDGLGDEALIAATNAVVNAVNPSLGKSSDWEIVATAQLGPSTSGYSSAPPTIISTVDQSIPSYFTSNFTSIAPTSATGQQNLAEAKDALWKLCEQLNAASNKGTGMHWSDVPPPPPPPANSGGFGTSIVLDFGPMSGGAMKTSAPINEGAIVWDDDSDSEEMPMETETAIMPIGSTTSNVNNAVSQFNQSVSQFIGGQHAVMAPYTIMANNVTAATNAHLWKSQDSFSSQKKADLTPVDTMASGLETAQPISLALDERMESQLGWQAEVCIRRWLLVNNVLMRMSLQMPSCFENPKSSSSLAQQRDQRVSHTHTSSAPAISDAFSDLFNLLTPTSSANYVESLLDCCWLLTLGNDTKAHEMPFVAAARAISLGEQAIKKLLSWLLDGIGITEKIWCLALRILATSVRPKNSDNTAQGTSSVKFLVIDDPNFPKVVRRLLTKVRGQGAAELAGPSVVQAFADLLTCIHLHLSSLNRQYVNRFREMLVQIILELLNKREFRAINQVPLDTLNKLLESLLNQPGVWSVDARLVADLAHSLTLNLMEYLSGCDNGNEALMISGAANPRYCFLVGKPDLATNEFRCFHDRLDVVMVNLLKLTDKLMNGQAESGSSNLLASAASTSTGESMTDDAKAGASTHFVAESVLDLKPSLIENLLCAIDLCCTGPNIKDDVKTSDISGTVPVTAADAIVQLLFTLLNRADSNRAVVVLKSTVDFLQTSGNDRDRICISDLSVFVLLRIFDICASKNEQAFGEANLTAVVADQLVRCCQTNDPPSMVEYSNLLKSAAAVSGRGPKSVDSSSKKLSDMKVDGMTNFAPLCSIASTSPMAHHLTALLNSTPPHRRARSAAWSYHFYPAESWLDMTLTLPYTIMLKEIQIRPHLGALQTSPSAVQVELSPDSNANSFRSLAPPVLTAGCTKIRIPTENFTAPVRMIRLHFRRPPDSTNLGMSQVLLLGYSPLSSEQPMEDYRLRWLQLLHHVLPMASRLDSQSLNGQLSLGLSCQLIDTFLNAPLNSTSYGQLISLFVLLENNSANTNDGLPFKLLLSCIGAKDCSYRTSSLVWLAEWISRVCANSFDDRERRRVEKLLQWVFEAVEALHNGQKVSLPILRCVVWSSACVLWSWGTSDKSLRRIPLGPELIRFLHKFGKGNDTIGLNAACGYLLCSIVQSIPEYLDDILRFCGLGNFIASRANASDERKEATIGIAPYSLNPADLRLLSFVAQSSSALQTLVSRGVLPYVVNILTSLCVEGGLKNNHLIVSIVELLKEVASDPFVKSWLAGSEGSVFWAPLLSHVCLSSARSSAPKDLWQRLETATITLLRRFITCHHESQRLVSALLGHLLSEISGGLNGSIQQLILRVLLEDEKLTVATDDSKLKRTDLRIHHPKFGCSIRTLVRDVSVYSNCSQLLPEMGGRKSQKNTKRVSYGASSEFSDSATYAGIDSSMAMAEVTFASEKNKAKRLAAKNQADKDASGKSAAAAACPIAYLTHEVYERFYGKNAPLPGKLTVGQLYRKLLSQGYDGDSLRFSIEYGLPLEIDAITDENIVQSPAPQSTLEVFARQGGLALLAEHLQLYQPTISAQNFRSGGVGANDGDLKALEDMQSSASKPFLNDPEMMDYYDPAYEWVNVASTSADGYGVEFQVKPQLNNRVRSMVNVGLSPHVVVCFGTFLRVAGYAELLVTQDRRQAQWLLRLAMGVTTDAQGANIVNNTEASSMGILPFEILTSLYAGSPWNTDEGRLVRATSLDLAIPHLLLRCLAVFSHQNERRSTAGEEKPEVVKVVDQLLTAMTYSDQPGASQATGDEKSHLYWAKGTGFGTGSTQQHWNVDLHIIKQKQDEQSVACLLKVLAYFIHPANVSELLVLIDVPSTSASVDSTDGSSMGPRWGHFVRLVSDSCLVPTLQAYLRNDSVLDISRHVAVYESVMRLLCSLALSSQLCELLTEMGDHQQSLRSLLAKLQDCVDIYISKLEPLRKLGETVGAEDAAAEEGLLKLVPLIQRASELVQMHKPNIDSECCTEKGRRLSGLSGALSNEERYVRSMKPLQFDSYKFLKEGNGDLRFAVPYHYEASVHGAGKDVSALAPCVRRLAQEAVTLSTSLPLSYSSSVFVRTADERLDVMKVLITGPCDTPYANGCFEFDVWFPTDYPNSPMHINLQTTGASTVRFNPNLYNDGKVCLSILNTWHGRPEERWNAQTSSFLQVLVSIQSLILVADPYFNEPGYERSRGTPAGQHASREYDANIRQATVRWGMLEMLRCPPASFKDVIHRHFWIKREEITKQVESWIAELEGYSAGGTDKRIQRNLVTHLTSLKRHYSALKDEFAKMTCPTGLEIDDAGTSGGASSNSGGIIGKSTGV